MSSRARPLSPHLQIYRLPLVALMSISHRITGVGLAIGIVFLACWLGSVAYGPGAYGEFSGFLHSFIGQVLLFLWSIALYFHLCNGIRHLFWDFGKGFALVDAKRNNQIVLAATAALTIVTWLAAWIS